MAHGIADRLLSDAQQLVLVLRLEPGGDPSAVERNGDAAGHGRALCEPPQRDLQSRATGLIEPQRHDGAPRLGKSVTREVADAVQDGHELRVLALAGRKFLGSAQLHQDAGERLCKAVVDFLADTRPFHQHGGLFRRIGKPCELHGERGLLRQRDEQLAAADVGRVAPEAQNEEPDVARAEHEGIDDHADGALLTVKREDPGPQLSILPEFRLHVDVYGLVTLRECVGEGRAGERHTRRERRWFELAVLSVGDYTPLLHRVLGDNHCA